MDEKRREPSIWLMPWRWPRWLQIALVPTALALYGFTSSPAFYFAHRSNSRFALRVCQLVYWPIDQLYRHVAWFRPISDWLMQLWSCMFG